MLKFVSGRGGNIGDLNDGAGGYSGKATGSDVRNEEQTESQEDSTPETPG